MPLDDLLTSLGSDAVRSRDGCHGAIRRLLVTPILLCAAIPPSASAGETGALVVEDRSEVVLTLDAGTERSRFHGSVAEVLNNLAGFIPGRKDDKSQPEHHPIAADLQGASLAERIKLILRGLDYMLVRNQSTYGFRIYLMGQERLPRGREDPANIPGTQEKGAEQRARSPSFDAAWLTPEQAEAFEVAHVAAAPPKEFRHAFYPAAGPESSELGPVPHLGSESNIVPEAEAMDALETLATKRELSFDQAYQNIGPPPALHSEFYPTTPPGMAPGDAASVVPQASGVWTNP